MKDKTLQVTFRPSEHVDGFYRTSFWVFASDETNGVIRREFTVKTADQLDLAIRAELKNLVLPDGYNAWCIDVHPGYKPREHRYEPLKAYPWPRGFKAWFGSPVYVDVPDRVSA